MKVRAEAEAISAVSVRADGKGGKGGCFAVCHPKTWRYGVTICRCEWGNAVFPIFASQATGEPQEMTFKLKIYLSSVFLISLRTLWCLLPPFCSLEFWVSSLGQSLGVRTSAALRTERWCTPARHCEEPCSTSSHCGQMQMFVYLLVLGMYVCEERCSCTALSGKRLLLRVCL